MCNRQQAGLHAPVYNQCDMLRLCEATYENMSVLIRKNYFKKQGASIPWRETIFVKILKTVFCRQLNKHYDRNYSSPNNGFKIWGSFVK